MKKILILSALLVMLLTVKVFSQDRTFQTDTLISGTDSLVVDTLDGRFTEVYITVKDTGATYTDSVAFETWDEELRDWVRVGAINCFDNSNVSVTATANATRMYLLLPTKIWILRQRIINATYVAGRRIITSGLATKP